MTCSLRLSSLSRLIFRSSYSIKIFCRCFSPRSPNNGRISRLTTIHQSVGVLKVKRRRKEIQGLSFRMDASDSEVEGAASMDSESEVQQDNFDEETGRVTVSEVLIKLDDNLKAKLVSDLMSICDVEESNARFTLEANSWNMQNAIDMLLDGSGSDSDIEEVTPQPGEVPVKLEQTPTPAVGSGSTGSRGGPVQLSDVCSPEADAKKEKETEIERRLSSTDGPGFSSWAPKKMSVISWNLDGLDDKNLEKRMEEVVRIIEKEKHDVVFFQELLPYTFDYIARRLILTYKPVIGTEDPSCEYLTATFLRNNSVHYEDHYIIPYPNTAMGRNLLVTKAFMGRVKLALLNTHLESTAEFSQQRTVQLRTCFDICKSFDKEYNVIFGGDLNLRDKEIGGSMPGDMCDLWIQCGSRPSCQYTWDLTRNTNKQMPSKYQPKCRFDRLYFRSSTLQNIAPEFFGVTGIEKVPGTQSFPSDHWAILSFFALSKEARKPMPKKRKAEGEISPQN